MFQLVKLRDNYNEWNSLFFARRWLDTIHSEEIHEQLNQWNQADIQSVQPQRLGELNLPIPVPLDGT